MTQYDPATQYQDLVTTSEKYHQYLSLLEREFQHSALKALDLFVDYQKLRLKECELGPVLLRGLGEMFTFMADGMELDKSLIHVNAKIDGILEQETMQESEESD